MNIAAWIAVLVAASVAQQTDEGTITTAWIGLAGIVLAAIIGLAGAYVGSLMTSRAMKEQTERQRAWQEQDQRVEHDRKMFLASDSILSERTLLAMMEWLEADASYSNKSLVQLEEFRMSFEAESNQYLEENLRQQCTVLLEAVSDLLAFCVTHFVYEGTMEDNNNSGYRLNPELKRRDNVRYYKLWNELVDKARDVASKYKLYRKTVKNELML
jgi:hypothetical protein